MVSQNYCRTLRQVIDSKMVARDGIEPPTPAFQGRLASELSGLESADMIEKISVVASLDLGWFRTISDGFDRTMVVYWSWQSKRDSWSRTISYHTV
jgi:hypothetical protein